MTYLEEYNTRTIRNDKITEGVDSLKNFIFHKVSKILGTSGIALLMSYGPVYSEKIGFCQGIEPSIIGIGQNAVCREYSYTDFPQNYNIDIQATKEYVYSIFEDENGNITQEYKEIVDRLVVELEQADFSQRVIPWIESIFQHSHLKTTLYNMPDFIYLREALRIGEYERAEDIIHTIIVNSYSHTLVKRAFSELDLIPDEA